MQKHCRLDSTVFVVYRCSGAKHGFLTHGVKIFRYRYRTGKRLLHAVACNIGQLLKSNAAARELLQRRHLSLRICVHHPPVHAHMVVHALRQFQFAFTVNNPHIFHGDVVNVTYKTRIGNAAAFFQPACIFAQHFGNAHGALFKFRAFYIHRMLAEKMRKAAAYHQCKHQKHCGKIQCKF